MQINYEAMTLRLGHYAITNQGKGQCGFGSDIVSMFGVHGFVTSKEMSEIKVYILKLK